MELTLPQYPTVDSEHLLNSSMGYLILSNLAPHGRPSIKSASCSDYNIAELKTIQSTSRVGISSIKIEIKDEILSKDKEQVWSLVRDKIADVIPELPPPLPGIWNFQ